MTHDDILQAAHDFLALMQGDEAARLEPDLREAALRLALDRLALASHFADAPFDERELPDPPDSTADASAALYAAIGARFPGLGLYNVALAPEAAVGLGELGVGDAIDDLRDITLDLREFAARWELNGAGDALWHFRFLYTAHWGTHLRAVQQLLHARVARG